MALQRYEKLPKPESRDIGEEIEVLEQELADPDLNERAAAALKKNLELKRRLLDSMSEADGTVKALYTELDSMELLLEVLHQNSISWAIPRRFRRSWTQSSGSPKSPTGWSARWRPSSESDASEWNAAPLPRLPDEPSGGPPLGDPGSRAGREQDRRLRFWRDGFERRRASRASRPAAESEGGGEQRSSTYPRWARVLAHGIRARLGNTFVLHGNTHDLVAATAGRPGQPPSGPSEYVPMAGFLAEWVFGQRDVVIEYQRANGADLPHRGVAQALHRCGGDRRRRARHRARAIAAPRTVAFFALLDSFLKQVVYRQPALGVASCFRTPRRSFPSRPATSADDRAVRVFIQKWSTDPALLPPTSRIVLLTENLADVSARCPIAADDRDRGRAAR